MALRALHVSRVGGSRTRRDGEIFNEFEATELRWKEPGMAYCWVNLHPRVLPVRRRQGWKVCNAKDDFTALGCPENDVPGMPAPDGTLHFSDGILCKMPATRRAQMFAATQEKAERRRRAHATSAIGVGEEVAATLRNRGLRNIGRNVVEIIHPDEERGDYGRDYSVRDRRGNTRGDGRLGGLPDEQRRRLEPALRD